MYRNEAASPSSGALAVNVDFSPGSSESFATLAYADENVLPSLPTDSIVTDTPDTGAEPLLMTVPVNA